VQNKHVCCFGHGQESVRYVSLHVESCPLCKVGGAWGGRNAGKVVHIKVLGDGGWEACI